MGLLISSHCTSLQYDDDDQRLSLAIKRGDVDAVKTLAQSKPSLNCIVKRAHFRRKTTPLQIAALHGKLEARRPYISYIDEADLFPLRETCPGTVIPPSRQLMLGKGSIRAKKGGSPEPACVHLARYAEPRLQKLMMLNTVGKHKGKGASFRQRKMPKTLSVLTLLLDLGADSNGRKTGDGQTPLMFACKGGSSLCVERLLQHNADALAFESTNGRTCLHIACRRGHYDCVVKVLDAAQNGPISTTWGFARFVNVRDCSGAIPLHMAARAGHTEIVRLLLNHGALITAVTCNSTYGPGHGSTPLHCAARSGSLDCVEELLAWGADRTQKDIMGHMPYAVAVHHGNMACAAILNPSAAEPMVWPSPLKFMQELEPETRSILQAALAQVNHARNPSMRLVPTSAKKSKAGKLLTSLCLNNFNKGGLYKDQSEDVVHQQPSPELETSGSGCITCFICFDSIHKMIKVGECGHQMCAACTMVLCCLNKPKPPSSASASPPSCPFCRRDIARLTLAKAPSIKRVIPYTSTSTLSNHYCQEDYLSLTQLCSKRSRSLRRSISSSMRKEELDLHL